MPVWFALLLISVGFGIWTVADGGAITDLTLLAGVMAIGSLSLPVIVPDRDRGRPIRRKPRRARIARPETSAPRPAARPAPKRRPLLCRTRNADGTVLVDGSNVLYWQGGKPSLDAVARVVRKIEAQGLVPLVGFDANVGYLIEERYMDGRTLAQRLKLPLDQVSVSPRGQPADPLLLAEAIRLGARIVTNDRYRDWIDQFPQVAEPGFLVRGQIQGAETSLNLTAMAA